MMDIISHQDEECLLSTIVLSHGSEGILTCQDCTVRWINTQGNRVVKQFTCEYRPLDAVFMHGKYRGDAEDGPCVAILVSQNLLRIFTFSGQVFESVLNFVACKLHTSSVGIIIEKDISFDSELFSDHEDCILYALASPDEPVRPVLTAHSDNSHTLPGDCVGRLDRERNYISVWGRLIAISNSRSGLVSVHYLQEAGPEHSSSMLGSSFLSDGNSSIHSHPTSPTSRHYSTQYSGGGGGSACTLGLDDTAIGMALIDDSVQGVVSPDGARWRFAKKSRSMSLASKRPSNHKHHHHKQQQDLAAVLGVTGISGDGRSVSPYRGMESAHGHPILTTISSSGGSPNALSSLMSTPLEKKASMSVSAVNDDFGSPHTHPQSASSVMGVDALLMMEDFTRPFVLIPQGFVRVKHVAEGIDESTEANTSTNQSNESNPLHISFSLSPQGETLLHILCLRTQELRSYDLSRSPSGTSAKGATTLTPASAMDTLLQESCDMSAGSVPEDPIFPPSPDHSPNITEVRSISNVASVTHMPLGPQAFSRQKPSGTPCLYATVIVTQTDGTCRVLFGKSDSELDLHLQDCRADARAVMSASALSSLPGSKGEQANLLITLLDEGGVDRKSRVVAALPPWSFLHRRGAACPAKFRHDMCTKLLEILLCISTSSGDNCSASWRACASALLRFVCDWECQISSMDRDKVALPVMLLSLLTRRGGSIPADVRAMQVGDLFGKLMKIAACTEPTTSPVVFPNDLVMRLFQSLDEELTTPNGNQTISSMISLLFNFSHVMLEDMHMSGLNSRGDGLSIIFLAMYSCLCEERAAAYQEYYRKALIVLEVDVNNVDGVLAADVWAQQRLDSGLCCHTVGNGVVPSAVAWAVKNLNSSSSTKNMLGSNDDHFSAIVKCMCSWLSKDKTSVSQGPTAVDELFLSMEVHKYVLPHITLCKRMFSDLRVCRHLQKKYIEASARNKPQKYTAEGCDVNSASPVGTGSDRVSIAKAQDIQDYVALSAAFLSTCEYGKVEMQLSGEQVLEMFPYSLRLTIEQSLLAVRCDLPPVVDLWQACRLTSFAHCGACALNRWNWHICGECPNGNTDLSDGISSGSNATCCCALKGGRVLAASCSSCRLLKKMNRTHEVERADEAAPSLPADIFSLLGREDFVMNYVGSAVATVDHGSSFDPVRRKNGPTGDAMLSVFPHLVRSGEGIFACEENEIGAFGQLDKGTSANDFGTMDATVGSGSADSTVEDLDGLVKVERMSVHRFAEDERMHEACRLLRSSRLLYLKVERTPEMTDVTFRFKQQYRLLALCRRSLAFSVGRGMLTLASLEPLLAERLPIPPLQLSGRVPPTNATISLDAAMTPPDLLIWPEFHNGVAAGLRVRYGHGRGCGSGGGGDSNKPGITRNWILYNRTSSLWTDGGGNTAMSPTTAENSHAGTLLAFGLLGHLKVLTPADICEYLTKGHEPTTIASLIGLAASHIGSAHPMLSKTLCLHLPSLVYPSHSYGDLEVSSLIQTSALVGLGLLHCGKASRLMLEFFITELLAKNSLVCTTASSSTSVTPPADLSDTRETAAMAAGWALGMLLLARGRSQTNSSVAEHGHISDLRVEDRLLQCIDGGKRPQQSAIFGPAPTVDPSSKSCRVLEGDFINTNITTPGAVMALSLMYLRSNNEEIAAHIAVPPTTFVLDNVRPDLLLFRAMGTCLIMWDNVQPSLDWLNGKLPKVVVNSLMGAGQNPPPPSPSGTPSASRRGPASISPGSNTASSADAADITHSRPDEVFDPSAGQMSVRSSFQAMLCLLTGHCWGLALVYAGTAHQEAKHVLLQHLKFLHCIRDGTIPPPELVTFLGHSSTSETMDKQSSITHRILMRRLLQMAAEKASRPTLEMCVTLTAVCAAMVCAGSGDLDILRVLRVLRSRLEDVSYGSHMGVGMAIGMLFLGQGKSSFKRDDVSIGALILATSPRFPARTMDNLSHLQALRHLYVIAVEERCLHAIDVDTGLSTPIEVEVYLKSGRKLSLCIPTLLPELSSVSSIKSVSTGNYFPAALTASSHHSNTILEALCDSSDCARDADDDEGHVLSTCGCRDYVRKQLCGQKKKSTKVKFARTDAHNTLTGLHCATRAASLCIKRLHPVVKGFVASYLTAESATRNQKGRATLLGPVDVNTLWAGSLPSGNTYDIAATMFLRESLTLVPRANCFTHSDTSPARTAGVSSVGSALSSPCSLHRKSTTESFLLHSRLSRNMEQWSYSAAVEASLLRCITKAFPGFAGVNSLTASAVLENVSIMSTLQDVFMGTYTSRTPALVRTLKAVVDQHRQDVSREGNSKTDHLIVLLMGIAPQSERKCVYDTALMNEIAGRLDWYAVEHCSSAQWVKLLEDVSNVLAEQYKS